MKTTQTRELVFQNLRKKLFLKCTHNAINKMMVKHKMKLTEISREEDRSLETCSQWHPTGLQDETNSN